MAQQGQRIARANGRSVRAFGAFLRQARGANSLQVVVRELGHHGGTAAPSTLSRYETDGRIPDTWVLYALAGVYGLDFDGLMRGLVANIKDPDITVDQVAAIVRDLPWQGGTRKHQTSKEGADAATARLVEAERHNARVVLETLREELLHAIESAARTVDLGQVQDAAKPQSARRALHRKRG